LYAWQAFGIRGHGQRQKAEGNEKAEEVWRVLEEVLA
jgi:hypothetical protein